MKRIQKDELFDNLKGFLKTKGIELTDGSYSQGIHKTCSMLADVINLSQQGIERAKTGVDKKLDKVRQVIHEKTAPKRAPKAGSKAPPKTKGKAAPRRGTKPTKAASPAAPSAPSTPPPPGESTQPPTTA